MPFKIMSAPVPETRQETRTLTDPAQPGDEMTITLRVPYGSMAKMQVSAKAADYTSTYVENADENPVLLPGLPSFTPTEIGCLAIARIEALHVPSEDAPAMAFEEWCSLSIRYPSAFEELTVWSAELLYGKPQRTDEAATKQAESDAKNASAATTGSSSEPPSENAPATTLP